MANPWLKLPEEFEHSPEVEGLVSAIERISGGIPAAFRRGFVVDAFARAVFWCLRYRADGRISGIDTATFCGITAWPYVESSGAEWQQLFLDSGLCVRSGDDVTLYEYEWYVGELLRKRKPSRSTSKGRSASGTPAEKRRQSGGEKALKSKSKSKRNSPPTPPAGGNVGGDAAADSGGKAAASSKPKRKPEEIHPEREAVCERLLPVWVEVWGREGQTYRVTGAWRQAVRLAMADGYEESDLEDAIRGSATNEWIRANPATRAKISWILRVTKDSRDNPTDNVQTFRDAHRGGEAPSAGEAIADEIWREMNGGRDGQDRRGGDLGGDGPLQADVLDDVDPRRPESSDEAGDGRARERGGESSDAREGDRPMPPAPDGEGEEGGSRDVA